MSKPNRAAFTVVELLVVIVIISLCLAMTIKGIDRVEMTGRRHETMTRLRALAMALQVYRADYGDVPPYNPEGRDYNGDGQPDPAGAGLWSLVFLDYLSSYRFLNDPASAVANPWVANPGGGKLTVVPGDPTSMALAYNAYYTPVIAPVGRALTQQEEYKVYCLLARPTDHATPACTDLTPGAFNSYDDKTYENWCSWMMQDPYSREWKYEPIRRTVGPSGSGTEAFAVQDPNQPDYYHRQLSPHWTDYDTARYLPASDTVVTWSTMFRVLDRRPWNGTKDWGTDILLYADGHVSFVAGPSAAWTGDASQARALTRPPAQ